MFDVGYINYASERSDFIGVERLDDGGLLIHESQASRPNITTIYQPNARGDRIRIVDTLDDPTRVQDEGWYVAAARAQRPVWSEIYQWQDKPDVLSISASYPVFDADRRLIGVIGVDLILSQVNDFLDRLPIGASGEAFIVDRNGQLVASSSDAPTSRFVGGEPVRLRADQSSDPMIQTAIATLTQELGSLDSIQAAQLLHSRSRQLFIQAMPYRDDLGLDWLIVITVPQSEFMAQIDANTRTTILLCLATLAGAIALGLHTSRWIAAPLLQMSRVSAAVAKGDLDQQLIETVPIAELEVMAHSFNLMTAQLRSSFDQVRSALQRSEAKFGKIFHTSPDAIAIATFPAGCLIDVNPSFCQRSGYERDQVIDRTLSDLKLWVRPFKPCAYSGCCIAIAPFTTSKWDFAHRPATHRPASFAPRSSLPK
ncbi:MAG: HAMP domain-containing protein [Leptolyngbyaceae cyanobacterium SM1_3_5]|nr:HAMP domain-containing protein [Leptolyngbyaceae cyanobacterium SM1_3_5]